MVLPVLGRILLTDTEGGPDSASRMLENKMAEKDSEKSGVINEKIILLIFVIHTKYLLAGYVSRS